MTKKIFAIGDIHGCYTELMLLFKKLPLDPKNDKVIFMGDYLDRGPDSNKVVTQLIKWKKKHPHWVFLYGNHEDILKNWVEGKQKYQEDRQWSCFLTNGGKETLKSYGITEPVRSAIPKDHLDFLFKETKMMHETKDYVFVHAGLVPKLSISKHLPKEDSSLLWIRDKFIDSDWDWGKKVIFGHSPAYKIQWGKLGQPIIMDNKIGLDGAVCSDKLGANLIAIELPTEKFYFQKNVASHE
jgi:serine/threonine protein phosphatase 1